MGKLMMTPWRSFSSMPAFWSVGVSFFLLMGRAVFGVSVGSLPAAAWDCVPVLLILWVRHPALGAADS